MRQRKIHRIPQRAEACGIAVTPSLGAFYIAPEDKEPITVDLHQQGRHKISFRRPRHMVVAKGLWPVYSLWAVDRLERGIVEGEVYDLPNVHHDGSICHGGARHPKSLGAFDALFWASPFNSDLSGGRFPAFDGEVNIETMWRRHYVALQANPERLDISRTVPRWDHYARPVARHSRRRWNPSSFIRLRSPDHRHPEGCYHTFMDVGEAMRAVRQAYGDVLKSFFGGKSYWGVYNLATASGRAMLRRDKGLGGRWGALSAPAWKGLSRTNRRECLAAGIKLLKLERARAQGDDPAFLRLLTKTSEAIGIRCGQRSLPSTARTPKQAKDDAEVQRGLSVIAAGFPALAKRHRAWFEWNIEWNRAKGKVRARRAELRAEFLALHAGAGDALEARIARVSDFFAKDWRPENAPKSGPIIKQAIGSAYYMGPRCPAIFLTEATEDLRSIPRTHQAVPLGLGGACAGAFATQGGDGWVLAFPHAQKGLAEPWRATCAIDGQGLRPLLTAPVRTAPVPAQW